MDALQEPHETLLLAVSLHPVNTVFASFDIPLSWGELLKRTAKETSDDDCLGLAAQLAYYFFLALFPAILFLIALASFFPLTTLINNAGFGVLKPLVDMDLESFSRVFATNVTGAMLMAREAAKHFMERKSGHIINIG